MANSDDGNHHTMEMDFLPNPTPPPPSPPIPFNLCGFRTGDTVQVRGDTGELQFSVHFNLRREEFCSGDSINFLEENIPETEINRRDSVESSPYLTPTSSTGEFENRNIDAGCEESSRDGVVTRLRSGVLSPVKYYSRGIYSVAEGSLSRSRKRRKWSKSGRRRDNVFDKMLKRRDSPLRPCSSYAFFLVKNWGVAKRSSFVETSKRLSRQWSRLPNDVKKVYEDMALKDNARYKRQCLLLRKDLEQQIVSGLLPDSD